MVSGSLENRSKRDECGSFGGKRDTWAQAVGQWPHPDKGETTVSQVCVHFLTPCILSSPFTAPSSRFSCSPRRSSRLQKSFCRRRALRREERVGGRYSWGPRAVARLCESGGGEGLEGLLQPSRAMGSPLTAPLPASAQSSAQGLRQPERDKPSKAAIFFDL